MLFFLLKPPIVCSDYYIFLTKINQSNKFKHFLKIPCSAPFKVKALKMIKGKYPHTGRIEDGGLFSLICFCMHMYNITDNKLEHCETVTSITANDTDYIPQLFFFFFSFCTDQFTGSPAVSLPFKKYTTFFMLLVKPLSNLMESLKQSTLM